MDFGRSLIKSSVPGTTVTTDKTLTLADTGVLQYFNNSTSAVLTVPTEASVAFPLWTEVPLIVGNTGQVTVTASSGVNINKLGSTLTSGHVLNERYAPVLLKKVASNNWLLFGGGVTDSVETRLHPGYTTGRYYLAGAYSTTTGTLALASNTIFYIPFTVYQTQTFDRIGINVGTSAASSACRLGLYTSGTTGYPSLLIADYGTVDTSTIGVKELTISQTLSRGVYFAAIASSASPTITANTASAQSSNWVGQTAIGTSFQGCVRSTFSYAALPSTAPNISLSYQSSTPYVYMRAA